MLYERGGIYLDADSVIIKPLNPDVFKKDCVFVYDKVCQNIFNGFIYTKKNNPLLKEMIEFMINDGGSFRAIVKNDEFDTLGQPFHFNIDYLSFIFQIHYDIRFKNKNIPMEFNKTSLNCWLYVNRTKTHLLDENNNAIIEFKNDLYRQQRY